jgi:hypothetical protein
MTSCCRLKEQKPQWQCDICAQTAFAVTLPTHSSQHICTCTHAAHTRTSYKLLLLLQESPTVNNLHIVINVFYTEGRYLCET